MDLSSARLSPTSLDPTSTRKSNYLSGRVLLLDSTQTLHQLKDFVLERLMDNRTRFVSLKNDDFITLGHALSVDREKKLIRLENGDTVSYEHLISASSSDPQSVVSSICALKVQHTLNEDFKEKLDASSKCEKLSTRTTKAESGQEKKLPTLNVGINVTTLAATFNGHECLYELHF